MAYSEKLLDYFQNPRCVGEIPDADAVAEVSNPVCGDVMKLWVKVSDGRIRDAKFKVRGGRAAIARISYGTELLVGMMFTKPGLFRKDRLGKGFAGWLPFKFICTVLAR